MGISEFINYTRWANSEVIRSIISNNIQDDKVIKLFSHLLNALDNWISRINKTKPNFDIWQIHLTDNMLKLNYDLLNQLYEINIETFPDTMITYKNSEGVEYTQPLNAILWHIINHCTHHRAQCSLLLRDLGIEPPVTDYIYYFRNK